VQKAHHVEQTNNQSNLLADADQGRLNSSVDFELSCFDSAQAALPESEMLLNLEYEKGTAVPVKCNSCCLEQVGFKVLGSQAALSSSQT
jgi:hypothetical protein